MIVPSIGLPVEGYTTVDMPVERMWEAQLDVSRWPTWNTCFAWSTMIGGRVELGKTLAFVFNPIERRYPYRMPAVAKIVEVVPYERLTWEVKLPGFHALHSFRFERLDDSRCRYGSWEVAEGALYRIARGFWLAHFGYVCESSLRGARGLAGSGRPLRYTRAQTPAKNVK
jgi:hypothetical protein